MHTYHAQSHCILMKSKLSLLILCVISCVKAYTQNEPTDTIKTQQLDEVVVTAAHQHTRIDGDGMLTTIQGTVLQNLGMAKDVLGYIPGVLNNDGNIEVFGKGTPMFYINGKPMRNTLELDQLRSHQIKSVKVITNPGARYGSGINAVIQITTVKTQGEGFAIDSRTNLGVRDYLFSKELMNLNYRNGGFDVFSTLHYDYINSKGSSTSLQNIWSQRHDWTKLHMTAKKHQQAYDGRIGINYTTAGSHSFGAYYQAIVNPERSNRDVFSINGTGSSTLVNNKLYESTKTNYYQHLVDAYYSGNWGKWAAYASFDLMWRGNKESKFVSEQERNANDDMEYHGNSKSRMLAGELNLSRNLWKGNISVGAAYTNSKRDEIFTTISSPIPDNNNDINEENIGVYAELSQNIGRLMLRAGIRYEHINSEYYEFGKKMNEQSRIFNEFLPSLNLVIPLKSTMFQLGYSRKCVRPLYSQLSSTISYYNEFLYETGNPNLKSSFINNVSLNFNYSWFMLMASYKYTTGRIISIGEDYNGISSITLLKKVNSPDAIHGYDIMASISPGFIGNFYYPVFMGGIMGQSYKVEYRGKSLNMNRPIGIIRFNNIFKLKHDYMLTANFSWRSRGESDNVKLSQTWQIDLGATKTFNKHWDVKISITDILNTARKSAFTIYSGIRDIYVEKINNTRCAELTVGYRFNVTKSKYKGKGAGYNEKERL